MTSHVKLRKERVGVVDYDTQMKEVRCQLVDQLKVLDTQLEQKSQQLQDLTDYLRRRGEIEGEYARSLDKLAERFTSKIKKKEPSGQTVAQVWLALLSQTRQESRDHNGLSERCSNLLTQPLTYCLEYTQRLAKRSKEVCSQLQEGLLKATTELQTVWRTYYQYHSDYVSAEGKLKDAEKLEEKQKQSTNKKVERLIEKRQGKVQDIHLKCSKARNDYLLNLAAANGSMSNYYLKDISSLIDCADAGYHLSLSRVMQAYLSSHWRAQNNLGTGLQQLQGVVSGLDQNRDRDILLQAHHNTFCLPLRFLYQPHDGDQVSEVSAESEMRCDLETRFKQIQTRLTVITQETEQAGNSLLAAHSSLLEIISDDDLETNGGSGPTHEGSNENLSSKPSAARRKANLQETENLYVTRVREYLFGSSLESKLQAKHDLLKVAVEKAEATDGHQPRPNTKSKHMRKNKSNPNLIHNQKLFTGDMLDFLKASGQEIPLVVESCICYINLNGLHHEGIFRVPGSQGEVNNLRDAFEKGDEPLAEQSCDLDSVAGVLKLYFRGLEKPLFPFESTSQLLECTQVDNEAERAAQLKAVVSSFPTPTVVVMRYLFSFLHHVSQYSDENMMQPYNLAVCFGPSLVRCPQDDAVTLLPQINSLVKNLIVQHETVFPSEAELPGPVYEKCMTLEEDDCEPMMEEGDGDELETGTTGDRSTSPSPAQTQKKGERLRANSNHNPSVSRGGPTGGSVAPGVKFALQIPIGPQGRPQGRTHSPGFLRREGHDHSSSEDITVHVNKEVCRQMDSVFKELLIRQTHQDPTSTSTVVPPSSVQPPQKKGGREGRRGRASGLFKSADQLD